MLAKSISQCCENCHVGSPDGKRFHLLSKMDNKFSLSAPFVCDILMIGSHCKEIDLEIHTGNFKWMNNVYSLQIVTYISVGSTLI